MAGMISDSTMNSCAVSYQMVKGRGGGGRGRGGGGGKAVGKERWARGAGRPRQAEE